MATLGVREYARRRGCSHTAVGKAIKAGRIRAALAVDKDGKPLSPPRIDPDVADREWKENTDAQQQHGSRKGPRQLELVPGSTPAETNGHAAHAPTLADAQRSRLEIQSELARLDLEERSARLVAVKDVEARAFMIAKTVRDSILQIPARVSGMLASIDDEREVYRVLHEELETALKELVNAGRRR